jgi:hypothetical protein
MPFNRTEEAFGSRLLDGFEETITPTVRGRAGICFQDATRKRRLVRFESNMRIANLTPAKVMGGRSPGRVLWGLGVVVLVLSRMCAQSAPAGEYQVKAAFLYNFAKFVEWPPGSFADRAAPLRICVLGQDPFGEELRNIASNKIINGRKLVVDEVADLAAARRCHILFIAASKKAEMKQTVESLRGADVLTVGDTKGFAKMGGMINFVLEDDRVRFEVNQTAAEQTGLRISSKLLSVAVHVIE